MSTKQAIQNNYARIIMSLTAIKDCFSMLLNLSDASYLTGKYNRKQELKLYY